VSTSEPVESFDEFGNPIEAPKPEFTSFQMVKKMLRLKERQSAQTEAEKSKFFEPKTLPELQGDGKDKYYFDIKNNAEHYRMITNDMTDEEFKVFEEREKERIDAIHHTRNQILRLVEQKIEEHKRSKAERE